MSFGHIFACILLAVLLQPTMVLMTSTFFSEGGGRNFTSGNTAINQLQEWCRRRTKYHEVCFNFKLIGILDTKAAASHSSTDWILLLMFFSPLLQTLDVYFFDGNRWNWCTKSGIKLYQTFKVITITSTPQECIGYEVAITISYPRSTGGLIVLLKTPPKYRKLK